MPVHLRLRRMGANKRAFYRIVAADSRRARNGRFLEILGTYNPINQPATVQLMEEKITKWLDNGAVPSDTVSSLLSQTGFTVKYMNAKKGQDVSDVALKQTITERPKKTRRMKKAATAEPAAPAAAPAEAAKEE